MNEILIVEDDQSLGPNLKKNLELEGFHVILATNLKAAKEELSKKRFSLILLDWMLPDGQGIDFLREVGDKSPVIMLTARTDVIDKVLGLESGASDYITKPFEPRELLARIRAQLRVNRTGKVEIYENQNLTINLTDRKIIYHGNEVTFTKMEFDLLYLLASNSPQIFSREKLLDEVWGYENYPTTRTVDTHVLQIRQKTTPHIIETVRGVGYRFNPEHE